MTSIYLIRHCEAQGNLHRRVHGVFNSNITPKGERQLACLQKRFEPVALDAVYSSGLYRAKKTAECIAAPKGLTVQVIPQMHERSMGVWEDYSWHEIRRKHPAQFAAWRADPYHYVIEGGESEEQGGRRLQAALVALARQNEGKTIAVAAHSMIIKVLQILVLQCGYDETGWGENTSVNLLQVDGETITFVYLNDASHLPDALSALKKQSWSKGQNSLASYSLDYITPQEALVAAGNLRAQLAEEGLLAAAMGADFAGLQDGEPVGLIATHTDRQQLRAQITLLYVVREQRGYEYGSQLVGEAMCRLRARGIKLLTVQVAASNAALLYFFEKNLFHLVGEQDGEKRYEVELQVRQQLTSETQHDNI